MYAASFEGGYGATQFDQNARKPNVYGAASPRNVFMVTGVVLLTLLCIVPVWNAIALLGDSNYTYWVGYTAPFWMITLCLSIVFLYAASVSMFFAHARPQVQTEQTILMIANIFVTLLGLTLMLVSLPMSRQSIETYNNLMHRCDYSEQTHRLYEYSQVLQNIRAQPECATKFSVEECAGYEAALPYTAFLKALETEFRCSGFCYRSAASLAVTSVTTVAASSSNTTNAAAANAKGASTAAANATAGSAANSTAGGNGKASGKASGKTSGKAGSAATDTGLLQSQRHVDHVTPLALLSTGSATVDIVKTDVQTTASQVGLNAVFLPTASVQYPPTLFNDANYQATCEGMAARDMKNFAGDIGFQTFYQGIYLVLIAVATGFMKLIGFCVRKDRDAHFDHN